MTNEEKIKLFENELSYIKDNDIVKFTKQCLLVLPDYFFEIAASTTEKYHPKYALGKGGLVRHTKAAVRLFIELSRLEHLALTDIKIDQCVSALILHDGFKTGLEKGHTLTEHPLICCEELFVKIIENSCEYYEKQTQVLKKVFIIFELILTHMGQWIYNKDGELGNYKGYGLRKPSAKLEQLVHMCDYIASRKLFELNENYLPRREK